MIIYYTTFSIICQSDKYLKEEIQMSLIYSIELLGGKGLEQSVPRTVHMEEFYPPSFIGTEWLASISSLDGGPITPAPSFTVTFDNQDEYTAWVEQYKLTDPTLLNDLRVWNAEHGLSHRYDLRTHDGTVLTPLKLIPLD
jgi:hypothetical protein